MINCKKADFGYRFIRIHTKEKLTIIFLTLGLHHPFCVFRKKKYLTNRHLESFAESIFTVIVFLEGIYKQIVFINCNIYNFQLFPESPRFFALKGYLKPARATLKDMAERNNIDMRSGDLIQINAVEIVSDAKLVLPIFVMFISDCRKAYTCTIKRQELINFQRFLLKFQHVTSGTPVLAKKIKDVKNK